MYVPKHFAETDEARLSAFMARNSFALLTTVDEAGLPFASHLPLLWEPETRRLHGHMAKANPQWRHFRSGGEALVVFWGPHAYVSPSWYDQHPSVPTWNYATVHAYGHPRLVEGRAEAAALLRRLVETYEAGFDEPWRMELPEKYESSMIAAIQPFAIEVTRLEGKFKMSQNRDAGDRANVIAALAAQGGEAAAVAAIMREREAG
jgi:transcriptional regulator